VKIATFSTGGPTQIGVVDGKKVIPLANDASLPADMIALIGDWDAYREAAKRVEKMGERPLDLDRVRLHAPVLRPSKILAIGLNYDDHIAESGMETPKHQLWFSKQPNTITGPYDGVQIPLVSSNIDYEVELVAVIGKRGRHIRVENAPDHVFGYCVGNDVSVRDWQMMTPQWMLGKSFDTHGPIGPFITTADAVGDPHRLKIRSIVNGEVRQSSDTRHLVFNVWDQISYLSQAMTLEPGDLLFTGTPGGVGFAMKPPRFLASGDVVRCEIEELGAIENTLVAEAT
jgi:ureidoglycolate lyase